MRKKYFVMRRNDAYTVCANPDLKFWADWGIIDGPMSKKAAYTRMYTERDAVETRKLSV